MKVPKPDVLRDCGFVTQESSVAVRVVAYKNSDVEYEISIGNLIATKEDFKEIAEKFYHIYLWLKQETE